MSLYPSGNASLFFAIARGEAQIKFVYHRDIPNDRWNVFKVVDRREEFIAAFKHLKDAQTFCEKMNKGNL